MVPLDAVPPGAVGRSAAGFELTPHLALRFEFDGRSWDAAAAALTLRDADALDSFAVMASDLGTRLPAGPTWTDVVSIVAEWQDLFAPRGKPSAELELGLWGELWFLAGSANVDATLSGWRGPDRDAVDFFVGQRSVEVKTSRAHRVHRVSQSQVSEPVGVHEAWLLSLWVKADPSSGVTVSSLAESIVERATDRRDAWKKMATAGYRLGDRHHFETAYSLMHTPEWYPAAVVPRVREVDPGVSDLRYRVVLDEALRTQGEAAEALWMHFLGRAYGGVK